MLIKYIKPLKIFSSCCKTPFSTDVWKYFWIIYLLPWIFSVHRINFKYYIEVGQLLQLQILIIVKEFCSIIESITTLTIEAPDFSTDNSWFG